MTAAGIIDGICEGKTQKSDVGKHESTGWLARVPVADVPAVVRFLKMQGISPRVIYRDKSTTRPKTYYRGRFTTSGWSKKETATHADIYDDVYKAGENSDVLRVLQSEVKIRNKAKEHIIKRTTTDDSAVLSMIKGNSKLAFAYAKNCIRGPWPEGEPAISKNPILSLYYAKECLRGNRFELGEKVMVLAPYAACEYAIDVLKHRFLEAEKNIATEGYLAKQYLSKFPDAKDDWVANGWADWLD